MWLRCQYLKPCLALLVVIGLGETLMPAPPAGPVKDLVHGLRQRQHQALQLAANRGGAPDGVDRLIRRRPPVRRGIPQVNVKRATAIERAP
jgi:hypothetical protein